LHWRGQGSRDYPYPSRRLAVRQARPRGRRSQSQAPWLFSRCGGVAGFALVPLQQYRVVQLAPRTRNVALSLNASAIYPGQGTGAGLGALALGYGSLATLGWTGSICILVALALLLLTNRTKRPDVAPDG
jgi:predicted MFS family arabinose efflux permease